MQNGRREKAMSRYVYANWLLGVAALSKGVIDVDDVYNAPNIDICFCHECKHRPYCCRGSIPVNDDGFCSYGERSER